MNRIRIRLFACAVYAIGLCVLVGCGYSLPNGKDVRDKQLEVGGLSGKNADNP